FLTTTLPTTPTLFPYTTLFRSLLTKKDDPEVQWHAKNGLALLGAEIVCWIVFMILGFALRGLLSTLSCGIGLVECVVWLGFLVIDRKSTRLNSSHRTISYAVFC